jgi:hypothetical protein
MKIKTRVTHNFIELSVDEIETTVFKSDEREIEAAVMNLLDVVYDFARLEGCDMQHYLVKFGYIEALNDKSE